MSPTPTDVSYHRNARITEPGTAAGVLAKEQSHAADGRVGASRTNGGNTAFALALPAAAQPSQSGGPGNMPSGISVQELKQMTALRMAHAQEHVQVGSPFQHGSGTGQSSRGSSPARDNLLNSNNDISHPPPPATKTQKRSSPAAPRERGEASSSGGPQAASSKSFARSNSTKGHGNADVHRSRRHATPPTESKSDFNPSNGVGRAEGNGGGGGGVEVPPGPGNSGEESTGRIGGGRWGRSPLHKERGLSLPPPPPPASGNSSLRASPPTSSSMPHGLTVQELKELTKLRLAKEAFNIPAYAVLQENSQQQDGSARPSSPGGGNRDTKAPGGRGRPMAPLRRRQDSRSPQGGARSNPSSPNPDGSDRPHRRTRRGGRRGRNRSPRPDDQYSPSLSGCAGGSSAAGGSTAGAESRDGYSSASPSPSGRRGVLGDTWSEPDEHGLLRQRSSSHPRSTTSRSGAEHGHHFEHNQRSVVATVGPRTSATSGGGRGIERGDHNKRSGEQRRTRRDRSAGGERGGGGLYVVGANPGLGPQLDMMHGVGGVNAIGGGHSQSHNHNSGSDGRNGDVGGRMPNAFSVHGGPSIRSGRGSAPPGSLEPHWDAAGHGAGCSGNRGRAALHHADAAWIEGDRRRGEVGGGGSRDLGGGRSSRGGGGHHHEPMMPPPERSRPAHLDRGFGRSGGSGFDQANYGERDNGGRTDHIAGVRRGERAVLRGGGAYDPRGDPPAPPGHQARMHRSSSEVLSSSAGSRVGRPMSVANGHLYPPSSNHLHGMSASPHLRPRERSAPYAHARGSAHPAAGSQHGHLKGRGGGGGGGGGSHSLTTESDSGGIGRGGGGGGFDHDSCFQAASHHDHHGHHAPTLQRGVSAPMMLDPHGLGPLRQELLESLDRSPPGGWNGSSLRPHLPFMAGRNGQRSRTGSSDGGMGGSVGSGGGGGRIGGGYAPGLGLGGRMGERRVSSSSVTGDCVPDDISYMVAESVLVTPKTGGPAHWRSHSASLNYPAQAGHQYHGARRKLGDDHSTSSTDSHPSLRHDNSTSSGSGGGGMRAGPDLDEHHTTSHHHLLKVPSHQQMMRHGYQIGHNVHGGSSGAGPHGHFPGSSSVPNFGVAVGGGVHRGDERYDDDGLSVDTDGGAAGSSSFLSSMRGRSTIGGAGDGGGFGNDGIATQSPLLQGAGYPGSVPAGAFQRESFALTQGDRTAVGGGRGASSGIESDSFNSAGGGSVKSLTSPALGGSSPTVGGLAKDSLSAAGTGGASTNANSSSPMTSLTFSLELAGYTTTGGAHSFRLGGSNMSDGAGSTHESDYLGFDTAASDSGIGTSRGGPGVAGGGSGRFGGGTDGLGSSPASMHASFGGREAFSLPRHLEIGPSSFTNDFVGSTPGTSSLFSFNNHDQSRGGDGAGGAFDDRGKDEMADRLSLSGGLGEGQSPTLAELQRRPQKSLYGSGQLTRSGLGPVGAIGSSRSTSSVTSSPRDVNTGLPSPPMSTSRSPVTPGAVGNPREVDGVEVVTVTNGEVATSVGGGVELLNVY